MITKWTVANFKSINKETLLDLAPLTLFAGPNSSGKSTILQSLLLVSQTLAHKVGSRSVVLNGSFTRLGQFDDLRSYNGEFDKITIGWECRPAESTQMSNSEHMRFSNRLLYGHNDSIKEITCKLSFDANSGSSERELFQLQPQLFLFSMSLLVQEEDNTDQRYELTVTRSSDGMAKITNLKVEDPDNESVRASMEYDIVLDENSLEELHEKYTTAEPVGCVLQHFLPERLFIRINKIEELSERIQIVLMDDKPQYRSKRIRDRELFIPYKLLAIVRERLGEDYLQLFDNQVDVETGMSFREWTERILNLSVQKRQNLLEILNKWADFPQEITNILRLEQNLDGSEYQLLPHRPPVNLMNASEYLSMFFSRSVKYLGPLRDEPKPLYPLAAYADPTDVGLRGEMTAAVLNLHRERKIRYIPSSAYEKAPFDPTLVARSFELAVTDWLKYLGVAEMAHSVDKGKLGHELKVSLTEGGPTHDLTHVGVGVSQVLPILVMSLLAEADTTLIFEQPELHLHPMVQTRLGDFFLSIVLSGKQCLIETHSEYLINRLRHRAAAEGEGNRVINNLKVYFVEKEGGSSNFREVKMNEYGAIPDWPKGFFDQSQFESEAILRAATVKKKMQRGK